ncbi:SipW-dependent-type signal peptide-containing protein [Halobellus rufus]|uniref:SipW-dependent-type signal peptide-containing protein n=1 Tax=Halobellus rufus TaxID=1448860 RepID=UPI00067872CD|nr:SipW-dependent-type signal peptide-containing protein [Halobellus rufus]
MSTDEFELTRRNVLAGIGGIGVASAGAGLGTSAFFSDTESFENNTIAAGTLDLKVDWQEHYSYPQLYDGFDDPTSGLDVTRTEPSDTTEYVGLPDPENPMVWVHRDDLSAYMDNTSIEAYPDVDGDGVQDAFAAEPGETTEGGVGYICEDGADTSEDMDPTADGALRTNNGDTYDEEDGVKPLVSLDDVKPGDFGELTLSYHLCDNPGYVWLRGSLVANDENGVSEAEAASDEENGTVEEPGSDGELLDAIRTRLWYDDGDNVVEVDGEEPDDAGYLTPELSIGELLLFLEGDGGVQLCPDDGGSIVQPPAGDCPDEKDYDSVHTLGETVTIDTPQTDGPTDFEIPQNPKCTDFGLIQGVKTDEAPEGPLPDDGETTYETPYGDITVTTEIVEGDQTVTDWEIDSDDGYCVAKVIVKGGGGQGGSAGANVYSYDNADGDDDFTEDDGAIGAMSDEDTELQTPTGQDISHVSFCLAVSTDGGNGGNGDGDCCFEASTDHYLGLAWWLPTDVGNEVQSDSVAFDLGFYAEQCRHNEQQESV